MNDHIEKVFAIYEKQYDQLLKRAVSILGNLHDAEDVMQDLAIMIMEKEDIFANVENCKAYLFSSIRNISIDAYRKNRKSISSSSVNETQDNSIATGKEFERIEARDYIERLLGQCPSEIKDAFIKHVIYGYSINELSKELGMSANNLSQKISRMKRRIVKQNLLLTILFIIFSQSLSY